MAELNKTDFAAKWTANVGGAAKFKDNATQDIEAVDMREFADDIMDSVSFSLDTVPPLKWGGIWTFASNSNNMPSATTAGTLYITADSKGSPGDADYVPAGSWMISKQESATTFAHYSIK
jgi:hypothetical protein